MTDATTIEAYLGSLPAAHREVVAAVRATILANLGDGFVERFREGRFIYVVPLTAYPAGYLGDPRQPVPFVSVVAQRHAISLYLFGVYVMPGAADAFATAWRATGKRLDMGKACVRLRRLDEVALDVLGATLRAMPMSTFLASYQAGLARARRPRRAPARPARPAGRQRTTGRTKARARSRRPPPRGRPTAGRRGYAGGRAPTAAAASRNTMPRWPKLSNMS
ncbi:MAG: DUF1801 domain-containing protein [Kofleriaceae bacterium]